jgi:hypothetical protein
MYSRNMDMPRIMAAPIMAIFITITFYMMQFSRETIQISQPCRAEPPPGLQPMIQPGRKQLELPNTNASAA